MEIVSLHLVQLFRALLANSDKASDSIPQLPQSSASRRSTSLVQDSFAVRLFCFVRFIADIVECTAFEILYIVFLIEKLAREDINSSSNKKGSLITPNNIGTLLVCSFVVALKYLRDHAPPTSWWTRTLRLPATVLPVSERTFLAHLDYRLSINNDDFQRLRVFFGV
ncbi:hypothetical protein BLNAU_15538 [Blattamonas nauphoetae]|uniref:Cyclin N-terminal domain-containing protein n=1 Tax=Blattamonas nauphoetae TaxID=2049346 RepID=A0ABQ9XGY5_9EUKA|nr:hypothetical protein BLNAU_15538 [Blattamonas nauphoetae]